MKCHLTDHGTGVMLILRGPKFTGGKVLDALVSHVDLSHQKPALSGPRLPGILIQPPFQILNQETNYR